MAEQRGAHTYAEIMSQPEVWNAARDVFWNSQSTLRQFRSAASLDSVIFTGCGSTHYLAVTAATLFQKLTGIPSRAYPASEIALFPEIVFAPNVKSSLVTVSRSGETTETINALRVFRERIGNPTISITCASASTLAKATDVSLAADAANEESLAQTRSFTSMLLLAEMMSAMFAEREDLEQVNALPAVAEQLLRENHELARKLGESPAFDRFFFLGSGVLYGLACEAMLKMKEMSLAYSEAYHFLEFRHGPMSMVNDRTLVVGLVTEEAARQEAAVLRDMHQRGAQILALTPTDLGLEHSESTHIVSVGDGVAAWARPATYLPVLQLLAYYRAMSHGQNPDQPENLTFVISLDESLT